jgi:hypothetical protein
MHSAQPALNRKIFGVQGLVLFFALRKISMKDESVHGGTVPRAERTSKAKE